VAVIRERCRTCTAETDVVVGQAIYDGELVWHRGYRCTYCGVQIEEDGRGSAPDDVRRAILQQEGEWALTLEEPGRRATTALKLLRQALSLSLGEVEELRKLIPGTVVSGTKTEMERLSAILSTDGLQAAVHKLPARESERGNRPACLE
jgi:hypothetical protein